MVVDLSAFVKPDFPIIFKLRTGMDIRRSASKSFGRFKNGIFFCNFIEFLASGRHSNH